MWTWCDKSEDLRAATAVAENLLNAGRQLSSEKNPLGQKLIDHALKTHKASKLDAMLKLAKAEPGMTIGIADLDSDPWLLGVRNGVVDLKSGRLLVNKPSMLITRQSNANYDHGAHCLRWLQFLDQIFDGDNDTVETVQLSLGYTLTGSVTEEKLFICFGHGSNGKSVFNNVVAEIIGDYGRVAPSSLLTVRRDGDASPRNDLARLAGARYVSINELQAGDRLDEQIVKMLAGREMISARFLHKEFFDFMPTFKPWLRTNHKPIITGDDDGIWRRLVLIPFKQKFTDEQKDPFLEEKLLAERDGILTWMIEGALKWREDGLKLSQTIRSECSSYRTESDLLGEFVDDVCTVSQTNRVEQAELFRQYKAWCHSNGVKARTKKSFTRSLAERGYSEKRSNGKRFYDGLEITYALPVPTWLQ